MNLKEEQCLLESKIPPTGNKLDRQIVRSIPKMYGQYVPSFTNKRVLDVGGHVGSFAIYAAIKGASKVITIEPLPRNIRLLKRNCKPFPQIRVLAGAAVRRINKERYMSSSITNDESFNYGAGRIFTVPSNRTARIKVKQIKFQKYLDRLDPHILKMDCEGSEFDLLTRFNPNQSLKFLLTEFHFLNQQFRNEFPVIMKQLTDLNFVIIAGHQPTIEGKGHHGQIIFKRN